jgi:hypothetical protein
MALALNKRDFNILMLSIFCVGAILRIVEFVFNRSLWCDEGLLAINFLHRDFIGLTKPLDEGQVAPILFLWAEKLMMNLFGNSDLSLRVVPLVVSLLSLYLFGRLCQKVLGKGLVCLLVFIMFSASIYLLRYALEVKQYQGDMLVAMFFWLQLLNNTRFKKTNTIITFLVVGCVALWFSNVSVVVLFVAGLYIFWAEFKATRKIPLLWVGVFAAWAVSFGAYFFLFVKSNPTEDFMLAFWAKQFPPHNVFSLQTVGWLKDAFINIADDFVPFPYAYNLYVYLLLVVIIAGVYNLLKKNQLFAYLVLAPLVLHFLLAWLKKYPFIDKFILYQYPGLFITVGAGLQFIGETMKRLFKPVTGKVIQYVMLLPFIFLFVLNLFKHYPYEQEEIKQSVYFIKKEIKPGQLVYVYNPCQTVFNFYKETGVANFTNILYGNKYRDDIQKYKTDFTGVKGDVWLLFAHTNQKEEVFITEYLKGRGVLKAEHFSTGSHCFLFSIN